MIIHGDSRVEIKNAPPYESIITDPIWPNHQKVFNVDDSAQLLREVLLNAPKTVKRVTIVLGADSDPRWLHSAVPSHFPFLKTCFLEYCMPARKGRNLYTHLMAYCFGEWIPWAIGQRVIPSKIMSRETDKRLTWHPTPMRVTHCKFLVRWFGHGGVIDPFCGSGSMAVAAKSLKVPFWGCEMNEDYYKNSLERFNETQEPMF